MVVVCGEIKDFQHFFWISLRTERSLLSVSIPGRSLPFFRWLPFPWSSSFSWMKMAKDNNGWEEKEEQGWRQLHVVFSSLQGRLFQVVSPVEDMTLECFDFIQAISFWRSHWLFRTFELWIYGHRSCNIWNHIKRIGDGLLSRIIWQFLYSVISKVKHPLSLKTWSALLCSPYPSPTWWKPRQRGRSPQKGTVTSGGCQKKGTSFCWLFDAFWDDI